MTRKRIVTLVIVLGVVVIVAVGSWLAGSSIVSPAEAAARTAPPRPSPILVPIEERVLTSDIVTRGTARYRLPQSLSIVPSALKPSAGIVTTLPLRNTQLNEGDVILTASGRPVFILQGETPAYRDLVPGMSGNDVRQLENALKRLGFDPGPLDGIYDEKTSAAVADWYASVEWEPFGTTVNQLANIRALEQDLAAATNRKWAAYDAVASARLAVQAARDNAESANKAATANVGIKTRARNIVNSSEGSSGEDRANAAAELAVAETAEIAARSAGEASIQAAVDAQKAAEREAKLANDTAERIAADLDFARRKAGVQVPADEIIFIPAVPVRVEEISAVVGDAASGRILKVTNNQLAIDSSLALDEAPLVKPGMAVSIDEPDLGIKATGTVARVADTPGTFGADGFHIYFEVLVDETPTTLEGFSLRLTVPVKSTGGAVIAVPVSALSLAADGTSRVQVDNNGSLEFVVVEPGLSADGFVEVKPVNGTLTPGQLVVIGYENK
jgi:peptidoglycan hydrolase-like protein with peptidoglycan-binding domain